MMRRLVSLALCAVVLCLGLAALSSRTLTAGVDMEAPFFTWGALQRFWNKMSPPGLEITRSSETAEGYSVFFGRGVALYVTMSDERVQRLRLVFDNREELGGGPLWLLAVATTLKVGTYGWPADKVNEAAAAFAAVSSARQEYRWGATTFTRIGHDAGVWDFTMEYRLE